MMGQVMETLEAVEGFAVETLEGLIFTVKGMVHPPHRLIAYLRFMPDAEGDRKRGSIVIGAYIDLKSNGRYCSADFQSILVTILF